MNTTNFYTVLELELNASEEQIKTQFKKLVRKYHPDVSKEVDAEIKFKKINEAYDTLSDSFKRSSYDLFLKMNHNKAKNFKNQNTNYNHQKTKQTKPNSDKTQVYRIYYEVLGIKSQRDLENLEQMHLKKIWEFSDKYSGDELKKRLFYLKMAKEVLMDNEKRSAYNLSLKRCKSDPNFLQVHNLTYHRIQRRKPKEEVEKEEEMDFMDIIHANMPLVMIGVVVLIIVVKVFILR